MQMGLYSNKLYTFCTAFHRGWSSVIKGGGSKVVDRDRHFETKSYLAKLFFFLPIDR